MANITKVLMEIEGIQVKIEASKHAQERAQGRDVTTNEILSLIVKVGDRLLDLKNGEEVGVIDKETGIGVIASVNTIDLDIFIDIVTVIHNDNIWISRGLKVISAQEMFNQD